MNEWISVNDRLPEPETSVLVAFDDGEVWCLWQNWTNCEPDDCPLYYSIDPYTGEYHTVTHWMPMPEPPKGG